MADDFGSLLKRSTEAAGRALDPKEAQGLLNAIEGKGEVSGKPMPTQMPSQPTSNFKAPAGTPDFFTNEDEQPGVPNQPKDETLAAQGKPHGPGYGEMKTQGPAPSAPAAQPPSDPKTQEWQDLLRRVDGDDGHANTVDRYGVPPDGGALEGLKHFFSLMPKTMARGAADTLGMPIDIINAGADYYAHHPNMVGMEGGPPIQWGAPEAEGMPANQQMPQAPGGSQDVRRLAGSVGINTNLPSEEGDTSRSAKWAESLGGAMGGAAPFTPLGMARAAPIVMNMGKSVAKDMGLSAFAGGLGRELAENIEGPPGTEKAIEGVGQTVGLVGALKAGGAVTAGVTAAKILATAGMHALERSNLPQVSQLLKGQFNASELMQQIADNPALAAQNAGRTLTEIPQGMVVPPPTASMDLPTQALMHQIITKDHMANANYRELMTANDEVLKKFNATGTDAGIDDVSSSLQALQASRTNAKQTLISQAMDQSDQDLAKAIKGTTASADESGELRRAYEGNIRAQLVNAWAESAATTRAEFAGARAAGLDQASVPTTRLYDRFADMMSESIKTGMEDHFPSQVLGPLYNTKNPLKNFGPDGVPVGNITESYMLGSTAPWERMQGLYNNIDNEMQKVMRAGGDPVKLQYLNRMQDEVLVSMRDLRMGGRFAPGQLPTSLQNAINSAQENRRLFVDSPVGRAIGFNGSGTLLPDTPTAIRSWLANTPETVGKVTSMFDAVAARSLPAGMHPADALKVQIDGMLRQEFADAYRTGGVSQAGRWMDKNNALLSHDRFSDLQSDFRSSLNSRDVAERMASQGTTDLDQIRKSRAQLFLNAEPETAIERALSGNNKFTATQDILKDLKQDPTGRALQGFANMAFDRMAAKASSAEAMAPGSAYSWSKEAENYYRTNQGMFRAIDKELPGYGDRVGQWVKGVQMMDRIKAKPDIPLDRRSVEFSLTGMGQIVAKLIGADLGRHLGTGTIQVPGMVSQLAGRVYSKFTTQMAADKAQGLLSRAMIEPDVFQQLMQPMTTQQAAHATSMLMEPYLLSAPSVVYHTGQQYSNPQAPMNTDTNTSGKEE